jgi:hypothetical protein
MLIRSKFLFPGDHEELSNAQTYDETNLIVLITSQLVFPSQSCDRPSSRIDTSLINWHDQHTVERSYAGDQKPEQRGPATTASGGRL